LRRVGGVDQEAIRSQFYERRPGDSWARERWTGFGVLAYGGGKEGEDAGVEVGECF